MIDCHKFINNLNIGIIVTDETLTIYEWNRWFEIFSKRSSNEVQGKSLVDIFAMDEESVEELTRKIRSVLILKTPAFYTALVNQKLFTIDYKRYSKSRFDSMFQDVSITPFDEENNKVVIAVYNQTPLIEYKTAYEEKAKHLLSINQNLEKIVAEEIAKQKEQEYLLIQQSKMAAMGEMISSIAHQWRQPLNVISVLVQNLEDAYRYEELDETLIRSTVEKTMNQLHFMSKTIDDFRNFFKPDKEKDLFRIKDTILEVAGILETRLKKHTISFEITGDNIEFVSYRNEFKQVILNLINNACDAIIERQTRKEIIEGFVNATVRVNNKEIVITIRDNGGGIPNHVIDRIFEPYFTTKDTDKGTGIGLYMSASIIKNHMDGTINAHTVEGGAEFIICLPMNFLSSLPNS